ncbi:protein PIP-1-like [Ursus americanus]|uniref:protein PIP-1-like n=1 Tax=Ursus americanus TaxID=9643 RepID=UPI001E67D0DC|nr:protein PIP-1-like [Ursus americanus]
MGPVIPPLLLLSPIVLLITCYMLGYLQRSRASGHHGGHMRQAAGYFQSVRLNANVYFNAQMDISEVEVSMGGQSAIHTEGNQQNFLRTDHEDDSLPYGHQDRGDLSVPVLRPRAQIRESPSGTVNNCRELARL